MSATRKKASKNIDPSLLQQLAAAGDDMPVQAVIQLKPGASAQGTVDPAETVKQVEHLLQHVERATSQRPSRYNVFKRLGSFAVEGSPAVVKSILEQDEVASAVANRSPAAAIPPPPPAKRGRRAPR